MSRKGENIYKRKDGRWEGRFILSYDFSGKAKYGYVYARSYTEVKKKLIDRQCSITTKKVATYRKTLYANILEDWLRSVKMRVKESTYARYKRLVDTHISPMLGKYDITNISTQLIEQYIDFLLTSGRLDGQGGLSPKTVSDIITIIKSTMEYAKYHGYNVSCHIGKLNLKNKEYIEMRVLTSLEQNALLHVLFENMDLYKLGVLICLYTGIRIGELCALRWENIDLKASVLKVRKTMQRIPNTEPGEFEKTKIVITQPKSQCSTRDIPLPAWLANVLKPFQNTADSFLLTGTSNTWIEPRTMQNHFKHYLEDAKIKHANFHALRHTFATRCIEVGFDIKSLSEILGHTTVNITLNRYVHSSFELKCSNMDKLTIAV